MKLSQRKSHLNGGPIRSRERCVEPPLIENFLCVKFHVIQYTHRAKRVKQLCAQQGTYFYQQKKTTPSSKAVQCCTGFRPHNPIDVCEVVVTLVSGDASVGEGSVDAVFRSCGVAEGVHTGLDLADVVPS